jgi:hypothetical protein
MVKGNGQFAFIQVRPKKNVKRVIDP